MTARILVIQHEVDGPPGHVGRWLLEAGCTLDVRRPYADDALPDDLDGYDGMLVLGGAMGANDDDHHWWLAPTKDLVRTAAESALPTLGICLGHQLVATALGGVSKRNPRGQQVGLLDVGWTPAAAGDPLLATVSTAPRRGVQWNDDVVDPLPEGATVLAQTPEGEVQAARFGPAMWGVQLHPEVDETIVGAWVTDDERTALSGRGLDAERIFAEIAAARAELDQAWQPFAEAFARVVHQHAAHG
ncbi:type 1 glutamine amidotransferase [Nocardioides sp.]|uniref:type 1 glutamine amidotransferase n=1 Tax=Nocardioides sp. TaxID=35761 RepID=UPI001A196D73|nr:type 1 glutamine amidotransferase [Nocardioides sp.]MBJ7356256.1 type 1 glutamine amidotransferase [Nocardioides sp.]